MTTRRCSSRTRARRSPCRARNKEHIMRRLLAFGVMLGLLVARTTMAQSPAPQTESDAYTRYELLAPGSAKFNIIYEVTATTAGATYYFNPIRKGSVATDDSVFDCAGGR